MAGFLLIPKRLSVLFLDGVTQIHGARTIFCHTNEITQADIDFAFDYDCAADGFIEA